MSQTSSQLLGIPGPSVVVVVATLLFLGLLAVPPLVGLTRKRRDGADDQAPRVRPMGNRTLRRALLASLCATFAAGLIPSAVSAAQPHDTITPAPSTCPAQFVCTTIPSSADSSGGVVDAGPTQNLGDTQWVYVNLYQFTPGTDVEVAYCTDTQSLSAGPPLCASSGYVLSANPSPQYSTEILTDGAQSLSFQVLDIDSSNDPFQGQEPGDANVKGTFYCNATSPCSVDVIDSGVDGLGEKTASPDNTAQFPITFATPFSGCGGSAASVTTESEYGIEFLLPIASAASCGRPDPTLAFNTAQDGLGAVQSLAAGSVGVAFTDNPESSEQQAVLTGGNYKLIPVALTANVVGFKAEQEQGGILYPVSSFDLTPTMAAGVLTGVYGTPQSADEVSCSQSLGCPSFGGTVCTRKGKTTTCIPAPCPYHPTTRRKGRSAPVPSSRSRISSRTSTLPSSTSPSSAPMTPVPSGWPSIGCAMPPWSP